MMDGAAAVYIGTMVVLIGVFGYLLSRALRPGTREEVEAPKHRMMDD